MAPELYYETTGVQLYLGDCVDVIGHLDLGADIIFADPPYFLSGIGSTCSGGKRAPVSKGSWDEPSGLDVMDTFNWMWLEACQRALKPNGTIFISGTRHNIFSVGYQMQRLGYKILNDIAWYKVNPPPNLSCRYFTHATETIIWAAKNDKSKHCFNYQAMKSANGGKQMKSMWSIKPPRKAEKACGKFPAQKPVELLERILTAASNPGDLVLDPFNGSGTTGVACVRLGRRYTGIDKEQAHLDLTIKRLEGAR